MNGYLAQSSLGLIAALVMVGAAVRAMRRRKLTFSLFSLWVLVALFVGLAAPVSKLARNVAQEAGVSPSGVVLGFSVSILLVALWRISLDVSNLRRVVATLATHTAGQSTQFAPFGGQGVAVVLPAFNEQATVEEVVRSIRAGGHTCIVVDDGSSDATARLAQIAGATVLRHPTNLGVGAALRTGFGYAAAHGYEAVVQCDADGQHPVASIDALIHVWRTSGSDLVVGSRFAAGGSYSESMSPVRKGVIQCLAWYASRTCATPMTDPTSGFRILSRDLATVVAGELGDHYLADTFELIVRAARAGYTVTETQADMRGRQGGVASARGSRLVLYTARVVVVTVLHLAPSLSRPNRTT